jgi:hypothetical protein
MKNIHMFAEGYAHVRSVWDDGDWENRWWPTGGLPSRSRWKR